MTAKIISIASEIENGNRAASAPKTPQRAALVEGKVYCHRCNGWGQIPCFEVLADGRRTATTRSGQ
jgi:hypothetical protein